MATVADFCRLGERFRRGEETDTVLRRFDFSPGRTRRQRVIADGFSDGVVTIFLKHANYRDTARVMQAAQELARQELAPFGARLRFAGDVAVSQAMIPAVVRNQILSLPLALAGVLLVVIVLCGSLRLALLAILPVAISGLWLLGALGALGIPLGVATSMFFVIALGLGVDSHSIHLVLRFRHGQAEAAKKLAEVTPPIVINTIAVAGGFGLMAFSNVPANRSLGILIASGLVLGCLLTLTGLASWIADRGVTSKTEEVELDQGVVTSPDWTPS
ncbi:MAG: MMPL family transporter [Thermoanaerobaculia bacterium]|nr:MMPL family transporter [Thermoanaerobaculia bacterium]